MPTYGRQTDKFFWDETSTPPGGIEVVADCHLVFSYSYAAASEHMQYLSAPPIGSSAPQLYLCVFPPLPLFLSHTLYVCQHVYKHLSAFRPQITQVTRPTARGAARENRAMLLPAVWNELSPYMPQWRGMEKKKTHLRGRQENEWKAVGKT